MANFLYKDIDLKLRGHPVKKDLLFIVDSKAVTESIKMIVNTNFYERPFNSEFGGNIRALLFELADGDTAAVAKDRIISTIEKWEPRAVIEDVTAFIEDHILTVVIRFRLQNKTEVSQVDIRLRVIR